MKNTPMKWIGLFIAVGMLPLSAVAQDKGGDNWSISGWINEALIYYDDGDRNDFVQASDNGTTLGSRITLAGSTELENSGLDAGFEVILIAEALYGSVDELELITAGRTFFFQAVAMQEINKKIVCNCIFPVVEYGT